MKILSEKEQLIKKLEEINSAINHQNFVVNRAYKRKERKDNWGVLSFITDDYSMLEYNYDMAVSNKKLLMEYFDVINERLENFRLK